MKKQNLMSKGKSRYRHLIMCIILTLLCGTVGCGEKVEIEQCQSEGCKEAIYKNGLCADHYVEKELTEQDETKTTVTPESATTSEPTESSEPTENTETTESSEPIESLTKLNDVKVGDTVTFGTYEQDNDTANGAEDIEWYVIDRKDDEVLLLSKCCLDTKPYHEKLETVTWENCTLREWLNNDFYDKAFNSKEQRYIKLSSLTTEAKSSNERSEITTKDKVFLLSLNDVKQYFSLTENGYFYYCYDSCFQTEVTTYAWLLGGTRDGWWWLRSQGMYDNLIAMVQNMPNRGSEPFGAVEQMGTYPNADNCSVRPALWLDLNP